MQWRAKDVEFYVTDQDHFTVEAFDGWGLKQDFFATEYEHDEFAAGPDDVFGYLTSWSDY